STARAGTAVRVVASALTNVRMEASTGEPGDTCERERADSPGIGAAHATSSGLGRETLGLRVAALTLEVQAGRRAQRRVLERRERQAVLDGGVAVRAHVLGDLRHTGTGETAAQVVLAAAAAERRHVLRDRDEAHVVERRQARLVDHRRPT